MGPGQWPGQPGPEQPGDPNQPQGDGSQAGHQPADPAAYDQTAMYDPNAHPGMYSQGQPYGNPYEQQNPHQQNPYQDPNPYQQNPYQQPDPYAQGQYGAQQPAQQGWGDGSGWNAGQPAYAAGGNQPPNGPGYPAPGYGGPGGQPPKKNNGLIIAAIVVVVALVIGGIVAAVMFSGGDKKSDSAATSTVQTTANTDDSTDTSTDETTTEESTTDNAVSGETTAASNGSPITLSADGGKLFAIVVSDAQGVRTINTPTTPWTETFSPGDKTYFAVNPIIDPSSGGTASCKITQGGKTLASDSGTSARCSLILR